MELATILANSAFGKCTPGWLISGLESSVESVEMFCEFHFPFGSFDILIITAFVFHVPNWSYEFRVMMVDDDTFLF